MEENIEQTQLPELIEVESESELPSFIDDQLQEVAPSIEVQALEIRDVFFENPELQYDRWLDMDKHERVDALQTLENQVSEIAHRPAMQLSVEDLGSDVAGYFNGESIVLSERLLADDSMYRETLGTLFHEGRHAYQAHNLYSGEVVEQNEELVNAWRVNLDVLGYEANDALIFKEIGFFRYYSQPIEVDARVFANTVLRAIDR